MSTIERGAYVTLQCVFCETKIPHVLPSVVVNCCPVCEYDEFQMIEVDV